MKKTQNISTLKKFITEIKKKEYNKFEELNKKSI
jgi:hypothetical protein